MQIKSRKKGFTQIMEILRDEITNNMYAGEKVASQRELAKQFGVSQNIIHRVLNQLAQEGLVTRKKRPGTFVLPFKGQKNRSPEYYDLCVGLFHGRPEAYLFQENLTSHIVNGLHAEIENLNRHLLYLSRRQNGILPDPDDIPWNILYGLMVYNIYVPDVLEEIGRRGRQKTVLLDVNGKDLNMHSVSFKNAEAGASLAEIMLTAGHRNFLVFRQKGAVANLDPAYAERTAGFAKRIRQEADTKVTMADFYRKSDWPPNYESNMMKLVGKTGFTGVFMPGANLVHGMERYFTENKLSYPNDYSVATIGGLESPGSGSGITRVAFGMEALAKEGLQLLTEVVENKPDEILNRTIDGEALPGHSVAPPKK